VRFLEDSPQLCCLRCLSRLSGEDVFAGKPSTLNFSRSLFLSGTSADRNLRVEDRLGIFLVSLGRLCVRGGTILSRPSARSNGMLCCCRTGCSSESICMLCSWDMDSVSAPPESDCGTCVSCTRSFNGSIESSTTSCC
jgi:hypothetical protein